MATNSDVVMKDVVYKSDSDSFVESIVQMQRIGGLPLAVLGAVAAHQERIPDLADERLAGEERV